MMEIMSIKQNSDSSISWSYRYGQSISNKTKSKHPLEANLDIISTFFESNRDTDHLQLQGIRRQIGNNLTSHQHQNTNLSTQIKATPKTRQDIKTHKRKLRLRQLKPLRAPSGFQSRTIRFLLLLPLQFKEHPGDELDAVAEVQVTDPRCAGERTRRTTLRGPILDVGPGKEGLEQQHDEEEGDDRERPVLVLDLGGETNEPGPHPRASLSCGAERGSEAGGGARRGKWLLRGSHLITGGEITRSTRDRNRERAGKEV